MKNSKSILIGILVLLIIYGCSLKQEYAVEHALVLHGGSVSNPALISETEQKVYKQSLDKAVELGDSLLKLGKTSLEVVEQVISLLENDSLFNAGRGAVFTHDGLVELDASIMNGEDLNAGSVCGLKDVKNPIKAARKVMEKSRHVMLSGSGASQFAYEQGLEMIDNKYFHTQNSQKLLQGLLNKQSQGSKDNKYGTVGCVALDKYGNIAAGTSTGGMNNKRYGRIGDSPIIGAGTYANNKTCGVSCTGWGEYYIRLGFSRDISALVEYKGLSVTDACEEEIRKLTKLGGFGGVIALSPNGDVAMSYNTTGMFRAFKKSSGEKMVSIYNEEQ